MQIALITPSVAPLISQSELAYICSALPKYLRGLDLEVTIIAPMMGNLDPERVSLARRLTTLEVTVDGHTQTCAIYDGRSAGGANLTLLANDEHFGGVESFSADDESPKERAARAALFAGAVREFLQQSHIQFDLLHAHGWPGAAVLDHLGQPDSGVDLPSVLSLHDASDDGIFGEEEAKLLGVESKDGVRILERGIQAAARVIANSETYAANLTDEGQEHPLAEALRAAGTRFVGIPRGVDSAIWNPATDSHLPFRFDPNDTQGKARSKASLQDEFGLPIRPKAPLIGLVVKKAEQAGFENLEELVTDIARNDVQVIVCIGEGDELYKQLEGVSERLPDRVQVGRWELGLEHVITAACDLLIVPPGETENGAQHLRAHRYGTLPVALRVGSVTDTVIDADGPLNTGNGFTAAADEGLLSPLRRAISAYQQHEAFEAMRRRAMRLDHSWERSARRYEYLYREVLEPNAEEAPSA